MTLDKSEKRALSDLRMEKAREFMADAAETCSQGRHRTAINRAYYAVLSAARALLILTGQNPESHDGVVTLLSLHFIKNGLLPVEIIKSFKILLARRTDVDYGDFDTAGAEEAESSVSQARTAIEAIEILRQRLINDM